MSIQAQDYNLIVFLIILGIAGGVLLCWAGFHFFWDSPERQPGTSNEQISYMRDVKLRNLRDRAAAMGRRDIFRDIDERLRYGIENSTGYDQEW